MKEFSWSFSRLSKYETCPAQHQAIDILKVVKEAENPNMTWGNSVHQSFHKALGRGVPLPDNMKHYQVWVDKVKAGPGTLMVEQKLAITRQFLPTTYFADDVWLRVVVDVMRIWNDVGLALDWKTGAIKEDSVQLFLNAQAMFSTFPTLQKVRSEFVWLQENQTTPMVYDRKDMPTHWAAMLPRVTALEEATKSSYFPPRPSGLCKRHCPVSGCPFYQKGSR